MHLTEKETIVLKAFNDNEYLCGILENTTYSFSVLDEAGLGRSGPGVFSSLQSKGLITTWDEEGNDYVSLTSAGIEIVKSFI